MNCGLMLDKIIVVKQNKVPNNQAFLFERVISYILFLTTNNVKIRLN